MKKRFKSLLGNPNSSLNSIEEDGKARVPSAAVSNPIKISSKLSLSITKSHSDHGLDGKNESMSQHYNIKRRYASSSEGDRTVNQTSASVTEYSENSDVFEEDCRPPLDIKDSQTWGSLPGSALSFPKLALRSRLNRASIARREANEMLENLSSVAENNIEADGPGFSPHPSYPTPWATKTIASSTDSHKERKLHAVQLLCKKMLHREYDKRSLEEDALAQFYALLHENLNAHDRDFVNKIIGNCSQIFSSCLPASSLLLLDFLYACHTMNSSPDLKAPRYEAQIIVGSTVCFPSIYRELTVLKPGMIEPTAMICTNMKDYVVEAILSSCKKEPSVAGRCVALCSAGIWLCKEFTSEDQRHPRVKEAINVLLVSLLCNNNAVARQACSQLCLLKHHCEEILRETPEIPPRIIEVVSLTLSTLLNSAETKSCDDGKQLLIDLMFCLLDWCMVLPLELLTERNDNPLNRRPIKTVFTALQNAAFMDGSVSVKHSYNLSDLGTDDFDPNLHVDKVTEIPVGGMGQRPKPPLNRNSSENIGKSDVVGLAAQTILNHLTVHLGHFPLARGTTVLTSRVSEHHDVINAPDDLSDALFNSPEVQFLIYNESCLLSVVEVPAEDGTPGGGATAGMSTSDQCVRFIVRDAGGKYCWDSSVLYGPPNASDATTPVTCVLLKTLDSAISETAKDCCRTYTDYLMLEARTKRKIRKSALPVYGLEAEDGCADNLDQLLRYIGWSSPECRASIRFPLNVPVNSPVCLDERLQNSVTNCILRLHEKLVESNEENSNATSWQGHAIRPAETVKNQMIFHHARSLCSEMGFLSRDNRNRVNLLTKNERLLRELKNLDSRNCRETHKVAVFYIAEGQEDKVSILSNSSGSREYEDFVTGLGWEVDLSTHSGFRGKLQRDGSTGQTAPYYASSILEVVFHVATRFPSSDEAARNVKIRHLGNDEVHIVWSEHTRDYRRAIIPTEFGDVMIVIYPIQHGLHRIQIMKKPHIPYFGPLFDGAIVDSGVLPVLIRETAINAGRAMRSLVHLYQAFYEERMRYLHQIIEQFKNKKTYEEYCSHLFSPAPTRKINEKANTPPFSGVFSSFSLVQGMGLTTPAVPAVVAANTLSNNSTDAARTEATEEDIDAQTRRNPPLDSDTLHNRPVDRSSSNRLLSGSTSNLDPTLSFPIQHEDVHCSISVSSNSTTSGTRSMSNFECIGTSLSS